jgi:hypothetical protein
VMISTVLYWRINFISVIGGGIVWKTAVEQGS